MMMMLMLALGVSINGFAQSTRRGDVNKQMKQAIERVADAPSGTSYGVVEETSDKYVVATPFGRYTLKKEKDGKFERTETGNCAFPMQPKYPEWFYKMIVKDHGDIIRQTF